jgi:DNA-binding MarR family transcriptional regulator
VADNSEILLRAILSTTARQTFPEDRIAEIVLSKGANSKQLHAYNMCDGTMGQGEIATKLKLDRGNFSRTVARWIEAGIVFRLGEGRDSRLLHVYPLPEGVGKRGGRAK